VPVVLAVLLGLIGCTPVVLFLDGSVLLGFCATVISIGLVLSAFMMLPGEAAHLGALSRKFLVAALIPVLFVIFQTVPLPLFGRLASPVWQSVADAFGTAVTPTVSIDIGATVLCLCRYLAWIGLGLLTCAITIDRKRAELVLFALTVAAVVIAAALVINDVADFRSLNEAHDPVARGAALDAAALGVLFCAACIIRSYERFETRRASDSRSIVWFLRNIVICAIGFIICAVAVVITNLRIELFAIAGGLAVFIGIYLVRRIGLGLGGAVSVALIGGVFIVGVISSNFTAGPKDFSLKFGSPSNPSTAMTTRMLDNNPLFGNGGGSYHDLVPIYRSVNDPAEGIEPPTAAAQLSLEAGRSGLWAAMLAVAVLVALLIRAALSRGRDSFYCAAAASSLLALGIGSFGNPGLFGMSTLILTGAMLGLALGQSRSRTV
jgi:hypothetical protein